MMSGFTEGVPPPCCCQHVTHLSHQLQAVEAERDLLKQQISSLNQHNSSQKSSLTQPAVPEVHGGGDLAPARTSYTTLTLHHTQVKEDSDEAALSIEQFQPGEKAWQKVSTGGKLGIKIPALPVGTDHHFRVRTDNGESGTTLPFEVAIQRKTGNATGDESQDMPKLFLVYNEPDIPEPRASYPLHAAVEIGDEKEVARLIQAGPDQVNQRALDDCTPLHIACWYAHVTLVKYLIENGAYVDAVEKNGSSPLHLVCMYGFDNKMTERSDIVQYLISKKAKLDEPGLDRRTPLWYACENEMMEVVADLLKQGVSVRKEDNEGISPLVVTVLNGHYPLLEEILKHIKQSGMTLFGSAGHALISGSSQIIKLIQTAARQGDEYMLQLLLKEVQSAAMATPLSLSPDQLYEMAYDTAYGKHESCLSDLISALKQHCLVVQPTPPPANKVLQLVKVSSTNETLGLILPELRLPTGVLCVLREDTLMFGPLDIVDLLQHVANQLEYDDLPPLNEYENFEHKCKDNIALLLAEIREHGGLFHRTIFNCDDSEKSLCTERQLTVVCIKDQPLLHHVVSRRDAVLARLLLLHSPELADVVDVSEETSLIKAVSAGSLPLIYAHVDCGIDVTRKSLRLDKALAIKDKSVISALYVRPPAAYIMDTGEWYKSLHSKGRNLIRLCHEYSLAQSADKYFTFTPPVYVDDSSIPGALLHPDVYELPVAEYSRKIGRAIILVNYFSGMSKKRSGASIDVMHFARLFTSFSFRVEVWRDVNSADVTERIEREKLDWEHQNSCIFALIVMSHGSADVIECADGVNISVNSDIIKPFNGDNWPLMSGKPKLFIVQACRDAGKSQPVGQYCDFHGEELWTTRGEVHPDADKLVIYSTVEEFRAYTDRVHGAWFLEELVLMFELFSLTDHVEDIARKANHLLARRKSYRTGELQVAQVQTTLRKKLFLWRRLTDRELDNEWYKTRLRERLGDPLCQIEDAIAAVNQASMQT